MSFVVLFLIISKLMKRRDKSILKTIPTKIYKNSTLQFGANNPEDNFYEDIQKQLEHATVWCTQYP